MESIILEITNLQKQVFATIHDLERLPEGSVDFKNLYGQAQAYEKVLFILNSHLENG